MAFAFWLKLLMGSLLLFGLALEVTQHSDWLEIDWRLRFFLLAFVLLAFFYDYFVNAWEEKFPGQKQWPEEPGGPQKNG